MSIDTKTKQDLIKKFARKDNDTGSPEVQVAILTTRITNLSEHFKTHTKDNPPDDSDSENKKQKKSKEKDD